MDPECESKQTKAVPDHLWRLHFHPLISCLLANNIMWGFLRVVFNKWMHCKWPLKHLQV